jgi:hypothetical protein
VPDNEPFDPIAEAFRQWAARWPEQADRMAAVTSVMRVQQLLLARVEDVLKPYNLTFAVYEALRLLREITGANRLIRTLVGPSTRRPGGP